MVLAALLLLVGMVLLYLARREDARTGLPAGHVVYLDTRGQAQQEQALYDPATGLTGRPDYVVSQRGKLIPVEIKSGKAPFRPRAAHILQLGAYCLLVEAFHQKRPPYGIVKYADRAFSVDYTEALKAQVLDCVAGMRRIGSHPPDRSHDSVGRCRGCGYKSVCDQRLVA